MLCIIIIIACPELGKIVLVLYLSLLNTAMTLCLTVGLSVSLSRRVIHAWEMSGFPQPKYLS